MVRLDSPSGAGDRERRERLEHLQVELRQAKARLAGVAAEADAAVVALQQEVARTKGQLEAERVREAELAQRLADAEGVVASLASDHSSVAARQLGTHLIESLETVAEGAVKGVVDEWTGAHWDRMGRWDGKSENNGPNLMMLVLIIPMLGVVGLLVALMVQGLLR